MKTQILTLDAHDDVISVRDKMAWGQTGRILLVWPEHSQILTRRIDLILLQRHSASMGAQLALVTDHPQVIAHAGQLGLPVFGTPLEAQTAHWRPSRRRKARPRRRSLRPDLVALRQEAHPPAPTWMNHPAARLIPFALSVLALLVLTGFLLPAAQITLTPQASSQKVSLPVSASAAIQSVNLAGSLPARAASVIVEAQDSQASTGTVLIPVQAASGSVRFTNLTSQSVTIPQGTVVSTLGANPIRFATTREVTAPGGPGLSITASIGALQPGTSGNLPALSLTAIEGDLGLSLSVTNLSATSDGADSPAPAPTVLDQDILAQRIQATLQQAALEDLQASLAEGDYLLAPSLTIVQVIEESIMPPLGQAGEQVEMTLQVEYSALMVSAADLQALVTPILDASLPEGFMALPGSLVITPASTPTLDDEGAAHWNIQASRAIQSEISTSQAVNLALGLSISQAAQSMAAELPLGAPPQVSVSPAWWPRLPFLPLRIQVTILDAQGNPASFTPSPAPAPQGAGENWQKGVVCERFALANNPFLPIFPAGGIGQ